MRHSLCIPKQDMRLLPCFILHSVVGQIYDAADYGAAIKKIETIKYNKNFT